jgi:hypothetical protein
MTTENHEDPQKKFIGRFDKLFKSIKNRDVILCIGLFVVSILTLGIFTGGGKFLILLKDSEISRGLITFLVALATVLLAITLAIYVITADSGSEGKEKEVKERFSLAKEVLTTLVGILGTILGFYFGSNDKTLSIPLAVAEIHYQQGQLVSHVSGGTPPYRYTITLEDNKFKAEDRISKDGWIFEAIGEQRLSSGAKVSVNVFDAKDKSVSLTTKLLVNDAALPEAEPLKK